VPLPELDAMVVVDAPAVSDELGGVVDSGTVVTVVGSAVGAEVTSLLVSDIDELEVVDGVVEPAADTAAVRRATRMPETTRSVIAARARVALLLGRGITTPRDVARTTRDAAKLRDGSASCCPS
jgi:hypothetical protein